MDEVTQFHENFVSLHHFPQLSCYCISDFCRLPVYPPIMRGSVLGEENLLAHIFPINALLIRRSEAPLGLVVLITEGVAA